MSRLLLRRLESIEAMLGARKRPMRVRFLTVAEAQRKARKGSGGTVRMIQIAEDGTERVLEIG